MLQVKKTSVANRVPPHVYFFVSAIFHYVGPVYVFFRNNLALYTGWERRKES